MKKIKLIIILIVLNLNLFAMDFNWTWPVEGVYNQDHFITRYVDHGGSTDFMGGKITYSGHDGTDFYIYSPKRWDRGVAILAVADGIVDHVDNGNIYDRWDNGLAPPNNTVTVIHNDTIKCWYSHNRHNSMMVQAGDSVKQGQALAYIGSAGYSNYPHLHFEITEPRQPNGKKWDPFDESFGRHYWSTTPVYSADAFGVKEFGIYTKKALNFVWNASYENYVPSIFNSKRDSAKLHAPKIFGINEDQLIIHSLLHNFPNNKEVTIKVFSPDNFLFDEFIYSYYSSKLTVLDFSNKTDNTKFGTWRVEISTDGLIKKTIHFVVGEKSIYGPLFSPIAGKSLWVHAGLVYPIRYDSLSGDVTYTIEKNTNCFSIKLGGIDLIRSEIGATSPQKNRVEIVPIVAHNGTGFTDTFFVHQVDFSKPVNDNPDAIQLISNIQNKSKIKTSNPYVAYSAITLPMELKNGNGILSIINIKGEIIRRMPITNRAKNISWDGKDSFGNNISASYLILQCKINGKTLNKKIVYIP